MNKLMNELRNCASVIHFPEEFEGKFIMYAMIDNIDVIFFNEVGGVIRPFLPYPIIIPPITKQKIDAITKYLQEYTSNYSSLNYKLGSSLHETKQYDS